MTIVAASGLGAGGVDITDVKRHVSRQDQLREKARKRSGIGVNDAVD